jgi:HK97 family phage portal protein
MGLGDRLRGAWRVLTRDGPNPLNGGPAGDPMSFWGLWHGIGFRAPTGLPLSPRGALGVPVFNACVSLISQALAAEDWNVVREAEGGGSVPVENAADELLDQMTFDHKERFTADALISGNGFLHSTGEALVALPWENVSLQWSSGPEPPVYLYFDPMTGSQVRFAPEDLAHLRYRNWGRYPWIGLPPLLAIADAIGLGIAARVVQASEFQNGVKMSGYLTTASKLDPQKANDIGQRWALNYSGADRSGKTAVLEQGLTYAAIDLRNLVELQMAELQKSNDGDIARAFNIQPMVLGEIQTNRANSVEATRLFVMTCLQPMVRRVCDAIGLYLLSDGERAAGIRIAISLRDLTRGHGVELADSLSKLVLAGVISRNEARADLGLVATPDGAPLLVPLNMETVEQAATRIAANAATQAADIQAENVVALPRAFRMALK